MPEQRDRWSTRTAFILAAVGSAVGLGNVWRFPYVAYANGGGAFFIPYFVALLTAGIPLMILEFGLGQKMQAGAPSAMRKANSHTEWVGWLALLVGTVISCYYAVIMAYSIEYLLYSFKGFFTGGQMPWSNPQLLTGPEAAAGLPPEVKFFTDKVVSGSTAPGEMWQPVWHLALGLIATWVAVFWIVCRGVKRVGKVVMWTVPLPIILLVILAIRGFTLPGAGEGISYYLTPNFEKLGQASTWLAAYGQVFFSLTIGFGVMIAYASYRPRNSDVTNNAFIISLANCATSFFAGFAVFSVLGFLAFSQGGVPVSDVVKGGPGLAFITYPTAISQMGELGWFWPPLMAVAFFVMLLTLGIDSLFSLTEGIVAGLHDRYPWMTRGKVSGVICGFCCLVGVVLFGNRAGLNWLDIFDHWANDYGLAIVGLLQCLIVGYLYKTDDLRDYVNEVSEIKLWGWWELCVRLLAPGVLVYLLASQFITELGRGQLYGASGSAFDQYLWCAPAGFALLFVAAFALSKKWTNIKLVFGGILAFIVMFGLFSIIKPVQNLDVQVSYDHPRDYTQLTLNLRNSSTGEIPQWLFSDSGKGEGAQAKHSFGKPGLHKAWVVTDRTGVAIDLHAKRLIGGVNSRVGWYRQETFTGRPPLNPLSSFVTASVSGVKNPLYCWVFSDQPNKVLLTCKSSVEHIFKNPGKYKVVLHVIDCKEARQIPSSGVEESDPDKLLALISSDNTRRYDMQELDIVVPELVARIKSDVVAGEGPLLVNFQPEVFRAVSGGAPQRLENLKGFVAQWDMGNGRQESTLQTKGIYPLAEKPYSVGLKLQTSDGSTVTVAGKSSIAVRKQQDTRTSAALLCAVAVTILFGGLYVCIQIARKKEKEIPVVEEGQ
jgi:neurotransmitter:Na+ symporter, NSS family